MKSIAATFVLALCVLLPISGHAQANKVVATQEATQGAAADSRVQALQAELQVMKDFTQHILSTVYFTLGTVVVVLFAMVGFGWYQNFKLYERDKEALRQSLTKVIEEESASRYQEWNKQATERFNAVDKSVAGALELTHKRLNDLELFTATSVFRAAYASDTPLTDFMVLCSRLDQYIGRVSKDVLEHALSTILEHVERCGRIDSVARTHLLELANKTAGHSPAYAERLREVLAKKQE